VSLDVDVGFRLARSQWFARAGRSVLPKCRAPSLPTASERVAPQISHRSFPIRIPASVPNSECLSIGEAHTVRNILLENKSLLCESLAQPAVDPGGGCRSNTIPQHSPGWKCDHDCSPDSAARVGSADFTRGQSSVGCYFSFRASKLPPQSLLSHLLCCRANPCPSPADTRQIELEDKVPRFRRDNEPRQSSLRPSKWPSLL
jgi:hypothetical protein